MGIITLKQEQEMIVMQSIWTYPSVCIAQMYESKLKESEFGTPVYQKVLSKIMENTDKDKLDTVSIYQSLSRQERIDFLDNMGSVLSSELVLVTPHFFKSHVRRLREVNQAIALAEVTKQASQDFLEYNKEVEEVRKTHEAVIASTKAIDNEKSSKVSDIKKRAKNEKMISYHTNLPALNHITNGIGRGHLWVLGGYTSYGKSLFSQSFANHFIRFKHRIAYFTLEMTQEEVYRRINQIGECGDDWNIYENIRSYTELVSTIKSLELQNRLPDIIVIDYIQLFRAEKGQDNYNMLRELSHNLQALAVEYKIAILALSQVSRDYVKSGGGSHGFKGAGDIEEACDVALDIERIKDGKQLTDYAVLHVTKNRHGATGRVSCKMQHNPLRVEEVQDEELELNRDKSNHF